VAGTDAGLIEPAATTPKVTVDLARSSARLPLVGGYAGILRSTAGSSLSSAPSASRTLGEPTAPRPTLGAVPGS
jgi:X-Pro dipeptidyl-peptidase